MENNAERENFPPSIKQTGPDKIAADMFIKYLNDILYRPLEASLDFEILPESFYDFGRELQSFGNNIIEAKIFSKELAAGNLNCSLPSQKNEAASALKMIHSSLRHLAWQAQQVAKGDYNQRVDFMGDFSVAFNNMIEQLEENRKVAHGEKTTLEMYVQSILVNCPDPILLFDNQGKLKYVSDSFFGYCKKYNKNDVLDWNLHDLFDSFCPEQSLNEIERLYNKVITEKRAIKTEQLVNFGAAESSFHFEFQITPMLDTDGFVMGAALFLFDRTESVEARRKAEEGRELAEQSSHYKSNFLAKMSHEIRTPMNAILGMAELALREEVNPITEEYIHIIRRAGTDLLSIINDILDFSKIEAGKMEIIPINYLSSSLVNDVINIIKIKMIESRLRFIVNIDSNIPCELYGDSIRIRQITLNLLTNAVKYTEKGFVAFSVTSEPVNEDMINFKIQVKDSGRGIKQMELEKLFNEFTRLELKDHRYTEGTGLGLAISRSLVAAMNGTIEVESEFGKGSTFTVTLPQKISNKQKIALVNDPQDKNILIFERRDLYKESFIYTMENLGVNYRIATGTHDFLDCLASDKYSFIFLASALYAEIKRKHLEIKSSAKFALITEFGEAITDRNMSILTMPLFSLPVANFLNGASDNYSENTIKAAAMKFMAPEAKILVVDDIDTNLLVAEKLLQPYDMQVTTCRSGRDAIEEVKLSRFDLVLMDHMMPEMDGIQTVSKIRALPGDERYYKNLPIIALTADAVLGSKEALLENGFNDFLSKPIDTIVLNAKLEKWIPREKQKYITEIDHGESLIQDKKENEILKIDGVDMEKGLAMAGGKIKTYLEILSAFQADGLMKIREIKASLEKKDIQLYTIYVHALKSASAIIGAARLSTDAKALEEAGSKYDTDFIGAHNDNFIRDLEAVLSDISKVLTLEAQKYRETPVNMELLEIELSRLKTALAAYDSAGINQAADALQEFTLLPALGDSISAILQNKLMGEYETAISMIDTLLYKFRG